MVKKNNRHVAIIIPCYNEAQVLKETIAKVARQFPYIICVTDGSSDGSPERVKETDALLIEHPINLGQGAALQTGIEYALQNADIDYFVTFDADGQHDTEDVKKMLQIIQKEKVDIVLGSRFLGKVENISPFKKALLKVAVRFSNRTSGLKLTDTHNGLRVFNRHVAENLNITLPDYAHASEITERIAEKKFKYTEAPVTITYTDYSKGKGQSIFNAVNIGFDTLLRKVTK